MLIEHAPKVMRGGNSRHVRNLRAMHRAPTETMPGAYTEEEYWQDLLRVTEGKTSEPLAQIMIHRSEELLGWLRMRGVHFQPSLRGTLGLARTNAFFLGGGKALLNGLYGTAERLGVRVLYDTEARELEIEDRAFRSASVARRGFPDRLYADAVVIASGGFQANLDWLQKIWGDRARNFVIRGTPYNQGRMLSELIAKGFATVGEPSECHAVAIDGRSPKFDAGIVTRLDCVCFGIVVNKYGDRFYDEGEDFWPKRYAIWGRLIADQPDQIGYAVIDSKVIDNFMPSLFPPYKADSLSGLAKRLGLAPPALERTVAEFNSAVREGSYNPDALDDCHTEGIRPAKSHWALPLNTPPYFAYPLRPGITFTYLGVEVNEKAQVLSEGGQASPNIYAAGEIMAGNILGKGYCAGTGMTIGSVFGRIAGKEAACTALNRHR